MAKRKKNGDLTGLLTGIVVCPALFTWLQTNSILLAFFVFLLPFISFHVFFFIRKQKKKQRLIKSGIHEIDKMNGFQFEKYLSTLYESLGYQAQVTKASGDFGADLILKKDKRKIVVQAKRYSKNVGIRAVQEIRAAQDYYRADEAWVVTNQNFTLSAIKLANSSKVKLIGREQLINNMLSPMRER
ncbi:restriction endonuclease [Metabacillus fastidiosus]|uniref:Restriction endonuclease n=1 Tax=Metabacillus fastidiosus TaxID=1458 RepID=A0ABU6NTL0_9BACI|nr:restriction endonuclease [Metabacillus fastidiosus]MED4400351.1 restriction endonuclease [Metabacillus fastidiosus]